MVNKLPKRLVIKRRYWATPNKRAPTALLTEHGTKCCLGFLCEAMGVSRENMRHIGMPRELPRNPLVGYGRFCYGAAVINDKTDISNQKREVRLEKLFRKQGIKLVFE